MKIVLTMKDPDGVYDSLKDCGVDPNDPPESVTKYVEYGEYVRIEVDTDTGTAKVLET